MTFRIGVFSFLLGIAVFAAVPGRIYGQERTHTVQRGETFYSIARSLGIRAEDLMKYNGITDPAQLRTGQRLRIPVAGSAGSTNAGVTSYRVVRGDTLYSIARKFSVSVELLRRTNNLPENYTLREGDSLKLPAGAGNTQEAVIPPVAAAAAVQGRAEPRETVNSQVSWPVAARELSYMTGKLSGVVITGVRAEPVKCLARGTVLSAGPYRGFGKVAIVQVEGGYLYVYGGCESLSVKEGDRVGPGTELGKLGIDAVSNKPQLFFMVYRSNTPVDPAKAPRA